MLSSKYILIILLFFTGFLHAQSPVFTGTSMRSVPDTELKQVFSEYEVYRLPTSGIDALVQAQRGQAANFQLQLGDRTWSMEILPADVRAANYVIRTSDGRVVPHEEKVKTFAGYLTNAPGTDVRLTIDEDFLYGYVDNGDEAVYIEPLRHFDATAPADAFVVYEELDVVPNSGTTCAALETGERMPEVDPHEGGDERGVFACKELELAIASDYSMYQKYNGIAGTENHNLGVMNNVNGDYSSAFVHQISFAIVEQYISTCSSCDPWTSSTNSSQVLQSFTGWGPTGFSQTHDLGQFWTNRNFNGSTIGVAWLGVVCGGYRYHVLQDFSSSAAGLRVMTSHEIGHNFNSGHDSGGGYIMSPSVGNVTAWSSQSKNAINAHINARISCFTNCGSGGGGGGGGSSNPPVAAFSASQTTGCAPFTVQFSDQSTGTVTSRSWSFPGGSPSVSTLPNPTVTYPNQGSFNVSLTVANSDGSDVEVKSNYIVVNCTNSNPPEADFVASPTQGCAPLTVQFANTSTGVVTDFLWSFPGGSPSTSTQPNPTVVYGSQGSYTATLTVSNADGSDSRTRTNYIDVNCSTQTQPVASFTATPTQGCAPLTVFYNDTSTGGVTGRQWSFPGGTPASASGQYVSVVYEDMGQYTASLTVSNSSGTDTETKAGLIQVDCEIQPDAPVAGFTANQTSGCAPMTVQFTNQSTGDDQEYLWSFPGGFPSTSTQANPTVSYQNPGNFNVSLTVSNGGGSDTEYKSQYISVNDGTATADFNYTSSGYTVNFNNLSTNTTNYVWTFGDGASSTQANPTHTYNNPGIYNITLTAYGNCGQATKVRQIAFSTSPVANFSSDVSSGCAPLTVQYFDLSTGAISGRTWDFPGGVPATSTDPNPIVTYNSPSTYNVTLTVWGPNGTDTEFRNAYAYAGTSPTTYFQQSISGSTVSFNNLSNNADDYAWDFGDGNTSIEENPVHTYATPGQYTVTLYASNECSGGIYYRTILIATTPTAAFTADQRSGCAPLTVQFTDESSDFPTSWQWNFPGGTPSTSTEQNPVVVYDTPGLYDVSLTATNTEGSTTETQAAYIVVEDVPSSDFTATLANGSTVTFSNNSDNADSYLWDFGDGNTSTDMEPVHSYATPGSYTVSLTAINNCGSVSSTQTVTAVAPPSAGFVADQNSGCAPLSVQFTDTSTGSPTAWQWNFPGGWPASSTQQNPSVNYNSPGVYDVSLTVTNAAGSNTFTFTEYIGVASGPQPGFSYAGSDLTIQFSNFSNNANSYSWDFGDGNTSTDFNPTHTYAADGDYIVKLTAGNNCGTFTATQLVTIATPPVAGFTVSQTEGCAPVTIDFTNTSSDNAQDFLWFFPGGSPSTSTAANPSVTYAAAGEYAVTLIASNTAADDTLSFETYISVDSAPIAYFQSSSSGATVTFDNQSNNATTYSWDFGDGNNSTDSNPTHTYTSNGLYTVLLAATNDCGTTVYTEVVSILTAPVADFTALTTSGCAPLTVLFNNQSSDNATDYQWTFEGGTPATSAAENPQVNYDTPGTYAVTLTASNAAGSTEETKTNFITVHPETTVGFDFVRNGATVEFSSTSTNAISYLWNFGNGQISTEASPTVLYDADGTYAVALTATGICGSETITQAVQITTVPTANFVASTQQGCGPLSVDFTDASSSNATNFSWTFENGTPATSTEENPTVIFSAAGSHSVTLIVSNTEGSDTLTKPQYIEVLPPVSADFSFVQNGTILQFTNLSQNATSYEWNFGNGATATTTNPTFNYASDGTYEVTLTATGPCGTKTSTQTVTVVTQPVAAFTASTTSGCDPTTVDFTYTGSPNVDTYAWTFENGTPASSTEPNPSVVFSGEGQHTVSLIVSNSAGNSTLTIEDMIEILPETTADFNFVRNGMEVSFESTATNATSLVWDFGNGETSTESDPVVSYDSDGEYTVTLTATGLCETETSTQTVTISTLPLAGFSADATEGCGPFTVQFTNLSSANATEFLWSFPGGVPTTSTEENPVVTYATPGSYSVSLEAGNDEGTDTHVQTDLLTVLPAVTVGFSYSMNERTLDFTNSSQHADSYVWNFGDGNSSTLAEPLHTFAADGTYEVELTATNACGSEATMQTITISTIPVAGFGTSDPTEGCTPLSVSFDNTSDNAESYFWDFGNGETSTEATPSVIYSSAGSFDVTLIVSNAAGSDTLSLSNYITTQSTPATSFGTDIDGLQVSFVNTTTNADQYYWNFGDGNTSTEANPVHSYAVDGSYTVVLTAVNACGNVSFQQPVTTSTAPVAGFATDNGTSGCAPFVVNFENLSSSNADEVQWFFEGGNPATSTEWEPNVSYAQPGSYDVLLIASNETGSDTLTMEGYLTIGTTPTADFSFDVVGELVNFTGMLDNFETISWDFGDGGISNDPNPQHIYASDGTYTVVLSASNACGTVTASYELTINTTQPAAGFSAEDATICLGESVDFTNLSSSAEGYLWTFEGGQPMTSTDLSPSVQYPIAGSYDVTLIAYGNGTADTLVLTDFVSVGTPVSADFAVVNNGWTIEFNNLSIAADSFFWDFGDGTTSTQQHPTYTYTLPDLYEVSLIALNGCGADTLLQEIEVVGSQPLAAFAAQNREGCAPLAVDFQDLTVGTPSSWLWTFTSDTDTLTSTEQNPSVVFTEPGEYNVLLVVSNVLGSNSLMASSYVEVKGAPELAFDYSANGTTISFENQSAYAEEVLWYFGDGNLSILQNPVYTYQQEGTYEVILAGLNECGADTLVTQITISTTSTETPEFAEALEVFPNPNGGQFTLRMQGIGSSEDLTLRLVDQLGRTHYEDRVDYRSGRLEQQFDFTDLPSGVYLLQIENSEGSTWKRVMIE